MNNKETIKNNISAILKGITADQQHEFLGCLLMSSDCSDDEINSYSDIAQSSTFKAAMEHLNKLDVQSQRQLIDELIMMSYNTESLAQKSKDLKDLAGMDANTVSEFFKDNPDYFAD